MYKANQMQSSSLTAEEKKKKFEEQYLQHESLLHKKAVEKRERQEKSKDPKEGMLHIKKEFDLQHQGIREQITAFDKTTGSVAKVSQDLEILHQFYLDSNFALNSYDKQQYKEQLQKLSGDIQSLALLLKPKKKFKFSENRKKKEVTQPKETPIPEKKPENPAVSAMFNIESIQQKVGETITLSKSELIQSTYKIIDNSESSISISGPLETVYLYNNKDCTINLGPVRSSVFVEKCDNCTINLMAQQIRIHNSSGSTFLIYSASKSIIENCTALSFGQYAYSYPALEEDVQASGF